MILINDYAGLSIEVSSGGPYSESFHVRIQEHGRGEDGSWKPCRPRFLLSATEVGHLVTKLEQAKEVLAVQNVFRTAAGYA